MYDENDFSTIADVADENNFKEIDLNQVHSFKFQKANQKLNTKNTDLSHQYNGKDNLLINDYFKDVGLETLLKPRQELTLSALMQNCENKISFYSESVHVVKISSVCKCYDSTKNSQSIKGNKVLYKKRLRTKLIINAYKNYKNQLRNRFISSNLRLVASIAKKFVVK